MLLSFLALVMLIRSFLTCVFCIRFEMLKTADGSISGSLKVIENLKPNKKNKGKKGNKENDWTWKEQVSKLKY